MARPAASVTIPVLNGADTIEVQLDALAAQDVADELEILVMDNGSTDGTAEVVRSWNSAASRVQLVDASAQRGASYARNLGIERASSEHVLFCDADDAVAPGWARALLDQLASHDVVGGRVLPWDLRGAPIPAAGHQDSLVRRYDFLPSFGGNNAGLRRSALSAVGGLDGRMYPADDIDAAWRLQLAGHTFAFAPDAVVYARARETPRDMFRQKYAYGQSEVRLYGRFRADGMPRRSPALAARQLGSLVKTVPDLMRDTETRLNWFGRAGLRLGRVAGSVRTRTFYI